MVVTLASAPFPELLTTFSLSHATESVSSASTCASALAVTSLPSFSVHLGPAECWPMTLSFRSFNSASGPLSVQANLPSAPAWQPYTCDPAACAESTGSSPAATWIASGTSGADSEDGADCAIPKPVPAITNAMERTAAVRLGMERILILSLPLARLSNFENIFLCEGNRALVTEFTDTLSVLLPIRRGVLLCIEHRRAQLRIHLNLRILLAEHFLTVHQHFDCRCQPAALHFAGILKSNLPIFRGIGLSRLKQPQKQQAILLHPELLRLQIAFLRADDIDRLPLPRFFMNFAQVVAFVFYNFCRRF